MATSSGVWSSEAPSNIALIKYMGKREGNIPCNISLSHTLNKFTTRVSLEICSGKDDFSNEIGLPQKSVDRFLEHLKRIKYRYNYGGFFLVKSFSNFPHSAGIASSSSSFAALTMCSLAAICEIKGVNLPSPEEMSRLSREASGASCRSFFSPWSVWNGDGARKIDVKIGELNHDLALVDSRPKQISSGEAHRLVTSSPLFEGRSTRAEKRFGDLINSLNNNKWSDVRQICWEEFRDMHALFETSSPSFGYIQPKTTMILDMVEGFWRVRGDGPVVTIDAGPNVHFLWRKDQNELRTELKNAILSMDNLIQFM
jgi:diphosphomevalonate decarboxylase